MFLWLSFLFQGFLLRVQDPLEAGMRTSSITTQIPTAMEITSVEIVSTMSTAKIISNVTFMPANVFPKGRPAKRMTSVRVHSASIVPVPRNLRAKSQNAPTVFCVARIPSVISPLFAEKIPSALKVLFVKKKNALKDNVTIKAIVQENLLYAQEPWAITAAA